MTRNHKDEQVDENGRATRFFARVDESNFELATLTHEFAHYIARSETKTANVPFWQEIRRLKNEYTDELVGAVWDENPQTYNDLYLGEYAKTNYDEFLAEAFTEYMLTSNPSKYARLVGETVRRYYSRQ
jgi:hypothetical protein